MIYITGDTHGDFYRIERFCQRVQPARDDVMIILGDAGFNYYGGKRDQQAKQRMSQMPLTIFSIHGNHEQRPATIPSYSDCGLAWRQGIHRAGLSKSSLCHGRRGL